MSGELLKQMVDEYNELQDEYVRLYDEYQRLFDNNDVLLKSIIKICKLCEESGDTVNAMSIHSIISDVISKLKLPERLSKDED